MAVGIDPLEGPDEIQVFHQAMGYPWMVTLADRSVLERYNVISTSIKYAVDRHGTIAFHRGYGVMDAAGWERVFDEVLQR